MEGEPIFLGIDLGTSTVKAGLFTASGGEVALAGHEYFTVPDEAALVDIEPEAMWSAVRGVVRQVLNSAPAARSSIAALSISSHAETTIFLAADGQPVRPALFTNDARAVRQARALQELFGFEWIMQRTGQPGATPLWPACKIMWLREEEPEAFRRVALFLLPQDYLIYRLTGIAAGDPTVWLSSMMVDLHRRQWLSEVLAAIGVSAERLPQLLPAGTLVGTVKPEAAAELGLPDGVPVVVGALDQHCAALAAANVASGIASVSIGTVLAIVASTDRAVVDPVSKISCYMHVLPELYCLLPWNPTGGLALKWFKDRFGAQEQAMAEAQGRSVYDMLCEEAARVPAGCDGLVMLPHLQGLLFPEIEPSVRGAFCGFGLAHGKGHFTRAILEGVAFMLREALEGLEELGAPAQEVRLLGGAARSRLWTQIIADVCQRQIGVVQTAEAAVLGAAVLAATGSGIYRDIRSAVEAMVRLAEPVLPEPGAAGIYNRAYERYRALYASLKGWFTAAAEHA
jgi:xylulokinase